MNRIKYVQTNNRAKAAKLCPWALYILKLADGHKCFESYDDYLIALNNK